MIFAQPLLLLSLMVSSSSTITTSVIEVMANVTLMLAEEHSTRCIQIFRADEVTDLEREHVHNLWRVLAVPQSHTTTGIYSFRRYVTRKRNKPWKVSCYKPLKVILESPASKWGYAYLTNRMRVKDSVWVIFLDTDIKEFFNESNLLFDCQVIAAYVKDVDLINLYEVYRVRKDFPLRYNYYGNWTREGGLVVESGPIYRRRSDLEGVVLKAGSVTNWPTTWMNGSKWVGFLPKVWSEIEELTNCSTEYFESIDGMTGLINSNNAWNGLVGMAIRGEIDVIVSEITIEKKRSHVLDMFHPLIHSSYRLYFRQVGYNLQWDTIFKPFGKTIWYAVIVWLFLGSAVISVCYYISLMYGIENDLDKISSPAHSFFFVLQTLSQQGYHTVPRSASCRMLFFLSYLLSAILIPSYSASLISYLTQQVPYRPFNDLEMFYKDGRYRLLIKENTAEYGYFEFAKNNLLKGIFKYQIETVPKELRIENSSHAFQIVCNYPYYAFFGIEIIMSIRLGTVLKPECPILTSTTPISYIYLTMGAAKNSPYSGLINYHIIKIISCGIAKRIEHLELPRISQEPKTSLREVALGEVFQMFVLIGVSVMVSFTILLVENRVYKMKQAKQGNNKRSTKVEAYVGHVPQKYTLNMFIHKDGYLN